MQFYDRKQKALKQIRDYLLSKRYKEEVIIYSIKMDYGLSEKWIKESIKEIKRMEIDNDQDDML